MDQSRLRPPELTKENQKDLEISVIDPDNTGDIAAYYQFEIDNGFSEVNPSTTFEKMVAFRQSQIKDGKLQVAMGKEGDQLISTSVVVLKDGAMGKIIKPNEAWAAGTLVQRGKQSMGIGERMSAEQDKIALGSGKEFILTKIDNDNFPSMRLRMKVGYKLENMASESEEIPAYLYRKDLRINTQQIDWTSELRAGGIDTAPQTLDQKSPDRILLDPADPQRVQEALQAGYKGVFLLRPQDFGKDEQGHRPIEKNMIVFERDKTIDQPEK